MKYLLVILIVLGFAWTIPSARVRIQEALEPLGAALRPAVDWALNPTRRAGAAREAQFILREIENQRQMGRGYPAPGGFQDWVRTTVESVDDGLDPWGEPYYLEMTRQHVIVGSAGPDRAIGTADDIRDAQSIPQRRR
jgi:hypothetical protein